MKLIVQIPCYNEEATLPETVAAIPRLIQGIEFDPIGRRRGYWLFGEHPGSAFPGGAGSSRFIPAAKSDHSCQRSSSVQLSNAISTNCGGRSAVDCAFAMALLASSSADMSTSFFIPSFKGHERRRLQRKP